MKLVNRRESFLLFLGDLAILVAALYVSLLVRGLGVPSTEYLNSVLEPFLVIFGAWLIVFFISGLYEKHTLIFKRKLPATLFSAQLINAAIAIAFFYLHPATSVAPKTILFIDLTLSLLGLYIWRRYADTIFRVRRPIPALLVGSGGEVDELIEEVNENVRYGLRFIDRIEINGRSEEEVYRNILSAVYEHGTTIIVIDSYHDSSMRLVPHLYNLLFSNIRFLEMHDVYEEVFDRIPLSLIRYNWFLEHISLQTSTIYEHIKRLIDIIGGLVIGVVSLPLYPFIMAAIKSEDKGPIFYTSVRLGEDNRLIEIPKFRTMTTLDNGQDAMRSVGKVTKVGEILRITRLDELPQLWSVVMGDLSLVGPRPEIPELAKVYEEKIPYYNIRHLVKPGLSGWAQLYHDEHPHHGVNESATATKLSYDLYYLKNRSLLLDIKIAAKTLKKIVTRSGK